MQYFEYIKIRNFKIFGEEIHLPLSDTTVLIGPNNAGKTSIIQGLALWQLGIRAFLDSKTTQDRDGKFHLKGKLTENTGLGINRRDIEQVPNTDTRQLFYKGIIRSGRENTRIEITLGIHFRGITEACTITFKYFKSEIIYAYLSSNLAGNVDLLCQAGNININLLYPMSGLEREETILQEGAIRKQIGRGITAGLLRNVCYNIFINNPENWTELKEWMKQVFYVELEDPKRLANDDLILEYNLSDRKLRTEKPLDILQAGRGQLQMLLIIAFVMWRKRSIIMIDEPDAHLEVLRQSQVMEVLKSLCTRYECQLIIATHSEVIMNESESLNLLLDGKHISLTEQTKKSIKSSLREFGVEQYMKATIKKRVLYLEGTTDKKNLRELAAKLHHPLEKILDDRIFVYYTQSPDTTQDAVSVQAGYYQTHKKHFSALLPSVKGLKGIAVFDNDNQNRQDEDVDNGLKIRFWKQYEIENYFIDPESIMGFLKDFFIKRDGGGLFVENEITIFMKIVEEELLMPVFNNNLTIFNLYKEGNQQVKTALFNENRKNKKMSMLLETVFKKYAEKLGERVILHKSGYYQIIPFVSEFDPEVKEKLDEIYAILK